MLLPRALAPSTALLLAAVPAVLTAQVPPRVPGGVTLQLDSAPPRALAPAALRALPRATVTLAAHGERHRYAGVPLAALLDYAGAWPVGDPGAGTAGARGNLRGAALARYVVVTGADGYRAVLALAELDTATVGTAAAGLVVLADSVDGRALAAADGPWRLVVPGDRRPARSVRQVVALAVRAAP